MASGAISAQTRRALENTIVDRAAVTDLDNVLSKHTGKLSGATITIGAENANVRAITIQLTDEAGVDLDHVAQVRLVVFADSGGAALATGGSTGIAIGTDGAIVATHTAKLVFDLVSESDGDIDLTWTDTGTEEVYLGLVMPQGNIVFSDAIANT